MSTPKMYTEAEVVRRERAAFVDGANFVMSAPAATRSDGEIRERLAEEYPLPTVTRPRVVPCPTNPRREFRVVNGDLETRIKPSYVASFDGGRACEWGRVTDSEVESVPANADRVRVWADLFANPTEKVPADEVSP